MQPLCLGKFFVFVSNGIFFPVGSGDEAILRSIESTPLFRLFIALGEKELSAYFRRRFLI
jgi:hypothetical protein